MYRTFNGHRLGFAVILHIAIAILIAHIAVAVSVGMEGSLGSIISFVFYHAVHKGEVMNALVVFLAWRVC